MYEDKDVGKMMVWAEILAKESFENEKRREKYRASLNEDSFNEYYKHLYDKSKWEKEHPGQVYPYGPQKWKTLPKEQRESIAIKNWLKHFTILAIILIVEFFIISTIERIYAIKDYMGFAIAFIPNIIFIWKYASNTGEKFEKHILNLEIRLNRGEKI